jgi:acetyl-CoA synthetase (ADP-forming)
MMTAGYESIIDKALGEGRNTLSEHESKQLLAAYGIPVTREAEVKELENLISVTHEMGYPLVMKGESPNITHKTEKGLVRVGIRNDEEARLAFTEFKKAMEKSEGTVLVQEMVKGQRELVMGLNRDPQFGPSVMFGLGGIFTEILRDVSFRIAPLEQRDALEMMSEIRGHRILENVRGLPPADRDVLAEMLISLGKIGLEEERISEIDINPVILRGSQPIAVDALIVLRERNLL